MAATRESKYQCREIDIAGFLETPSASLQNCLKLSNDFRYISVLCDFGLAVILEMKTHEDKTCSFIMTKKLAHGRVETLEGHAWSPDDQLYSVSGETIYIYLVSNNFALLHKMNLYYIPKDVSLAAYSPSNQYRMAIAGPNGVELSILGLKDSSVLEMKELSPLHPDLAIVLVEFSHDGKYLAVGALDCHFGIWSISGEELKDFWYVHLNTVRITSIAFSLDSCKAAVACWDGLYYCYVKTNTTSECPGKPQWSEVNCGDASHDKLSTEKFTGVQQGALACFSCDSKCARFLSVDDKGSWISSIDIHAGKMHRQNISTSCDYAKGIHSLRCEEGDFSICLLRSRRILLFSWTAPELETEMKNDRKMATDALLYEDLYGSLYLVHGEHYKHNVKLRLIRPNPKIMEKLQKLDVMCWGSHIEKVRDLTLETNGGIKGFSANEVNAPSANKEYCDADSSPSSKITQIQDTDSEFPSSEQCEQIFTCPVDPALLVTSLTDLSVLVSFNHVVIARLPMVAYIWSCKEKTWKALIFNDDIRTCCLTQDIYLVTLSRNGMLHYWSLDTLELKGNTSLDLKTAPSERLLILVGSITRSVVRVFDFDVNDGDGEVMTINTLSDSCVHRDFAKVSKTKAQEFIIEHETELMRLARL